MRSRGTSGSVDKPKFNELNLFAILFVVKRASIGDEKTSSIWSLATIYIGNLVDYPKCSVYEYPFIVGVFPK